MVMPLMRLPLISIELSHVSHQTQMDIIFLVLTLAVRLLLWQETEGRLKSMMLGDARHSRLDRPQRRPAGGDEEEEA